MKIILSISILLLLCSCNSKLQNTSKQNQSTLEGKDNQVIGIITKSDTDTTTLIFTLHNLTDKNINIPIELGSTGNEITFTLSSGQPSKAKNPNGSWGPAHILKPNDKFIYEIYNYEFFLMSALVKMEKKEVGWFTLHWKMDIPNIKFEESIKLYYDQDAIWAKWN